MVTAPSENRMVNRSQFALGAALTLLMSVFGVAIPLMAYLCDGFFLLLESEIPKGSELLIRTSPWLPLLIAIVGSVVLLVKERRLNAASAAKWNLAAIVLILLVGGILLASCILPMMAIIHVHTTM
ncbi:MAG: hypothetical protein ABFD16_10165 [Thermoguttaceae bacterium]|jgi:hypothetical protein